MSINTSSESITTISKVLDQMIDDVEQLTTTYKPILGGEYFITDKELSKRLSISRRTLQDYRTVGKIPYFIFGGKAIYKESDIEKVLEENYCKGW